MTKTRPKNDLNAMQCVDFRGCFFNLKMEQCEIWWGYIYTYNPPPHFQSRLSASYRNFSTILWEIANSFYILAKLKQFLVTLAAASSDFQQLLDFIKVVFTRDPFGGHYLK